jgi:hypothetical protein
MPPITRQAFSGLLAPDLRRVYLETGKERPLEYPLFFNVEDLDWNPQTERQYAGLSTMPSKPEGTQFPFDDPIQGPTKQYEAVPFGLAAEITWEMWRDDLYGLMRDLIAGLARASRNRQEVEAWALINSAFDTGVNGFTSGEALCSTAHVGLDGVSRANRPSPDIGFSITGIQNSTARFEGMTDERNLPRLLTPVMALIHYNNKFVAREILGSSGKPFTADNEINALLEEDLSWMVCHYMNTATNWFLVAAKGVHDLWFKWRDRPIFDSFDDPRTKNAVFSSYQRHTRGSAGMFGSWRGIDGSTG